jgi:hypothetical protein
MRQFRLAVLLSWLAAAGCYNDAPPQSTLPEPQYVSGPPGGAMDPGDGYGAYGGRPSTGSVASAAPGAPGDPAAADDDDDDSDVDAPAPPAAPVEAPPAPSVAVGPAVPAPGEASEPGPAPVDEVAAAPDPAAAPTGSVTNAEISAALDGYGQWANTDDYGEVWRPDATVVGVDFTPYESGGSWVYTDAGWAFSSDYPWGWLPFHYGRWGWFGGSWGWVPGHRWGSAWVDWRHGGGVIGWRPRPPRTRDHRHDEGGGHRFATGPLVRDHRRAEQHDAHWRFAAVSDFSRPHIRSHLYGNAAEGLRVTSTVAAPPIRARASVRATDLMRSRFTSGAIQPGPGRSVGPQIRDHRGDATRAFQPPARTYQPPQRTYQPPQRTYQPPQRTYQPPVRAYQPPQRTYQPPVRTYQPPQRTYQPPVRTYQPPQRTYRPPVYQPPVRTYQPSAPPSHTTSPPSHSSSPPSHSSSPPSHSSSPPSHSSSPSTSGGSHSSSSGGGHHR